MFILIDMAMIMNRSMLKIRSKSINMIIMIMSKIIMSKIIMSMIMMIIIRLETEERS